QKFKEVLENPEYFLEDKVFKPLAESLINTEKTESSLVRLKEDVDDYAVYGVENIELGAKQQMNTAMKLPVTVAGALMPDAHQGYGLPIGGVLATKNALIP